MHAMKQFFESLPDTRFVSLGAIVCVAALAAAPGGAMFAEFVLANGVTVACAVMAGAYAAVGIGLIAGALAGAIASVFDSASEDVFDDAVNGALYGAATGVIVGAVASVCELL